MEMKEGKQKLRIRGFGSLYKRGSIWWIRYSVRNRRYRESSGSEKEADAMKLLKRRWMEIGGGRFIGPKQEKVTMEDLFRGLETDYAVNRRRSAPDLKGRLRHLRAAFGGLRVVDVTEARIERYKQMRLEEKTQFGERPTKPATVNRELAALRRAFRLGVRQKLIAAAPAVTLLEEHNVRQGFVEPREFEAIVAGLPDYLKDFARFAYVSGWRRGEIQSLAWRDVNREAQRIILRPEHSKNKEPRILPLVGDLAAIIERRWQARMFGRADGSTGLSEFVFHTGNGTPVGDFRKSWQAACAAVGMSHLLFHDLRRSAVRNFDRAGVSQPVGMMLSGHKTTSIYRRYRIVSEDDLKLALERTQAANAENKQKRVIQIQQARREVGE